MVAVVVEVEAGGTADKPVKFIIFPTTLVLWGAFLLMIILAASIEISFHFNESEKNMHVI